jgi:hypothetical protein
MNESEQLFAAFAHYCDQKNREALEALIKLYALHGMSQALRYQILGDIHFTFGTLKQSCIFYDQAAYFYNQVQQHEQSAALYEYLMFLDPENTDYPIALNQQYALIKQKSHPL